ncbi:hypothetical protein ABIE85_007718 [Bradyrhizobium diazoefficiens]|jgi:hypothetical protein|uniref:DUF1488 family protein n=1 Tax=Bradyrhizobium TaxID=374 RepID=UPI00272CB68B|nr:DUF1488 family protein [Bradyrhizobium diazoefficiens]WLA58031.1 DUF1488 family protein [Bradyrhizobium diazoefficiens]
MLVVDARTFGQIDRWDCRQIAYGADAVPEWARYRWIADDGREFPIAGAFDARNRMRGARLFRERVHFLGIVSEETYEREELQYFIRFYHNPALFASKEDALAALRTFPLFQPEKTRARRPDLFVHEAFEAQGATVQFGVVTDGRIVICRVHGDTLEDIEERGLRPGSEEMVQAFDRHKDLLRRLRDFASADHFGAAAPPRRAEPRQPLAAQAKRATCRRSILPPRRRPSPRLSRRTREVRRSKLRRRNQR